MSVPGLVARVKPAPCRSGSSQYGPATSLAASSAGSLIHFAGPDSAILLRNPGDLPLVGGLLRRYMPMVRNFSRSDHLPFWEVGLPGLMITDTADFRYPHYHGPTDTPEKLDYERLAQVAAATAVVIAQAAGLVPEAAGSRQG